MRLRVGPVRFGGGRRPSVTFGVGPFGATFGGGWYHNNGRQSSRSNPGLGDVVGGGPPPTPWERLEGLAFFAQMSAEATRTLLWGYSIFMGTLYWIVYWQGIGYTTLSGSLEDMAVLAGLLALVNVIYSKKAVPRLQRQLNFISSQRWAFYVIGWLGLTIAITICWLLIPEFRPGLRAGPNNLEFEILPHVLGNSPALWVLSYVLLGWIPLRQAYLREVARMSKSVREQYQELSSKGPIPPGANYTASSIQDTISNALSECDSVSETFRASKYLTRAAWRSPRTAKK